MRWVADVASQWGDRSCLVFSKPPRHNRKPVSPSQRCSREEKWGGINVVQAAGVIAWCAIKFEWRVNAAFQMSFMGARYGDSAKCPPLWSRAVFSARVHHTCRVLMWWMIALNPQALLISCWRNMNLNSISKSGNEKRKCAVCRHNWFCRLPVLITTTMTISILLIAV